MIDGSLILEFQLLSLFLSVRSNDSLEVELLDHLVDNRVSEVDDRQLDRGLLWDEIHLSFSFLFLKLERDASDGTLLNSLHKMRGITSNLVAKTFRLNNGDIINDALVEVEILRQLAVVLLDQRSGGSLDC